MRITACHVAAALFLFARTAGAAPIVFATDPFAGSDAPATPGRQVVGGELFTTFNIASDVFVLDPTVFGVGDDVLFVNDLASNVPATDVNVIVLQNADVPFNAGLAANLIAAQVTAPGPGFFIYFNSGLDLPRLVYSTDLSDPTSDLKILARLTNLMGQDGRDVLPTFTAANFEFAVIPEPGTLLLASSGAGALAARLRLRRRRPQS